MIDDRRVFRKFLASLRPGSGHWRELLRQVRKSAQDYNLRSPADINVLSSSAELNIVFLTRYFQPYESHFDRSYLYVGPTIEKARREEPMTIARQAGQRLIYIAVGTVYRANARFFRHCMEALADPKYAVIMSVGKAVDPGSLGQVPANFTVAQYVPQLQVLQEADLFITHGGMNSINEAVTYGVPMVVVPNTIEQTINAARIEQLRCGLYLDHTQLSVDTLRGSRDEHTDRRLRQAVALPNYRPLSGKQGARNWQRTLLTSSKRSTVYHESATRRWKSSSGPRISGW